MMTVSKVIDWLARHANNAQVAIDDDGLTLVIIDPDRHTAFGWLEVGGIPQDEGDSHGQTH